MNDQKLVIYQEKGTKKIYDSAYTEEQVREAVSNCRMSHKGAKPTTILASKFGGRLTA